MRMRGVEHPNKKAQTTENKRLIENDNPVLSTSLDKTLQKHSDLEQIISAWPNLPEHIKVAIQALVESN